jgi:hypothetical protein
MVNAGASSHSCTHTKSAMGWVSATDVARHQSGTRTYDLHAIGLRQPPPPGRVTAVRVPVVPLEARLEVDQYERRDVSGEGIIVYEDSAPGRHLLGCPWAHRQPAKVVPCRRYTFWYTSLPTSRARTGTKPLVTVPPLTDSGMPVVHARRRRSGAAGPVARLPAATIRRVRPPWLVPRRR